MTPLAQLIARVEGASGPDRQIDVDLFFEIEWEGQGDERPAPAYTASVDAALALAERVLPQEISDILHEAWSAVGKAHALHIRFWDPKADGSYVSAIALAICLALLRAIEATPNHDGERTDV